MQFKKEDLKDFAISYDKKDTLWLSVMIEKGDKTEFIRLVEVSLNSDKTVSVKEFKPELYEVHNTFYPDSEKHVSEAWAMDLLVHNIRDIGLNKILEHKDDTNE